MAVASCGLGNQSIQAKGQRDDGTQNRPAVSIKLMRSCLSRRSFLSGFPSRRIVLCKEENAGTRATRCSSRVFGLVEARRRTNSSFSHLEVVCFREQFGDWNRLVDTMLHFSEQ